MQICIYDSQGRRICYSNHATAALKVQYSIDYYDQRTRTKTNVDHGELPETATRLDKLERLVAAANQGEYKSIFAQWDHIAHTERPWQDGQPTDNPS